MRRKDGKPEYRWQKEFPPIDSARESELVKAGELKPGETRFLPRDEGGEEIQIAAGSVAYNAHRKRYVAILGRKWGKDAFLGEIYYAESDAPTGPFHRAVKIATHDRYTFYNPVHHAFLDRGRHIHFEGTYTAEFSGSEDRTPLYDYNQILYRLDLDDPRLAWAKVRP